MARPKSKLNEQSGEYIKENILEQEPEGLPDSSGLIVAKEVPECRWIQFINGRDPGQTHFFHYHSKTHPLKHYTLYHGQEHLLPEEIITHLEDCAERQYGYRTGRDGHPEMFVKGLKYLYQCRHVNRKS